MYDPDSKPMMLRTLRQWIERVEADEVTAIGIAAATTFGSVSSSYVMPTIDSDPAVGHLLMSVAQLADSIRPAACGTCGEKHGGLLCPKLFEDAQPIAPESGHESSAPEESEPESVPEP